ncbi:MAG TPA: hypothetical protein PKC43_03610 [Phycisphaerales bacterium]|nr:hypothetical protein [Phycisphaerales bacterium]HMP36514.1 hypothetical protein [Phycisphaerales bacterium]
MNQNADQNDRRSPADRPEDAPAGASSAGGAPSAPTGSPTPEARASPAGSASRSARFPVERVLAELNRLRGDLEKDPTDPEWFAIHHAFCFVSYRVAEFQRYLDEVVRPGEHPE